MNARVAGTLLLALAGWCQAAEAGNTATFRGGVFDPPRPAPDFTLSSTADSEFRLSRFRGRAVVLGFGYTFCPDVCPTTLADLAQMRKRLGEKAARVQVAYVTVDPERDSLDRLRIYMRFFDPTFIGLTGSPAQLAEVRRAYGVAAEKRQVSGSAGYLVHHSSFVFLIDPAGQLRGTLPFGMSADDMAHDVALLLLASPAPLRARDAWARALPLMPDARPAAGTQGSGTTAVYLTIDNSGVADTLLGAASDAATSVEIHETTMMGTMAMMAPIKSLAVPAGGTVQLKPGGYHLMLLGLKRALKPGTTIAVILTFERAGQVSLDVPVR